MAVFTTHDGKNDGLIAEVSKLYIADGDIVADITFGHGTFWSKTDVHRFHLLASDRMQWAMNGKRQLSLLNGKHIPQGLLADFRALPYRNGSLDHVIFDPPYAHNASKKMVTNGRYRNGETFGKEGTDDSSKYYHEDIIERFYRMGMTESRRVLKDPAGRLFVKTKDEVSGGVQRWSHLELYTIAIGLGFFARDLFILRASNHTSEHRWTRQIHARKDHSYLWVFELPDQRYRKDLVRAGIFKKEPLP